MIIDINAIINKQNRADFPAESTIKNLPYITGETKVFRGNKYWLSLSYKGPLENGYLNRDSISIIVLGKPSLRQNGSNDPELSNEEMLLSIFKLYKLKRDQLILHLKGSFIIIIFDENSNNYLIYNDRMGFYELLYTETNDAIYLSTNINSFNKIFQFNKEPDLIAVSQQFLFDAPLKNRSLLQDIKTLEPGWYIDISANKTEIKQYHTYINKVSDTPTYTWNETLEQIAPKFNQAMNDIVNRQPSVCAGLTSGFDSRTNLARLATYKDLDVLYYSWGLKGSIELDIALTITKKFNLKYKPLYLDERFEREYDEMAHQSVILSNGKGPINRANHTYGYKYLSEHSNLFVTGLIGSELLKPRNCGGYMYTQLFLDLISTNDQIERTQKIKNAFDQFDFITKSKKDKIEDELISESLDYIKDFDSLDLFYKRLYFFMLKDGFRNYFGHEVHPNRIYGTIVTPYADDDFIDFLLKTPIPDLNKMAFKDNLKSKLDGSRVYIPIIKENFPELLNIATGRYIKPKYLNSSFVYLHLMKAAIIKRFTTEKPTFDSKKWSNSLMKKNKEILYSNNEVFNPLYFNTLNHKLLTKVYSLNYFFNTLKF